MTAVSTLHAQPETVRAIVSGACNANNVYMAIGQPISEPANNGQYEVTYGVAQSQLDVLEVDDENCENEPYTNHDFDIPASAQSVGTTNYELYSNHVTNIFGYDRLTKLTLKVWPVYAVETSEMYHGALPVIDGNTLQDGTDYQLVEGNNTINYSTVHGCDSVVTIHVSLCPYTVKDADSNVYNTLVLSQYCWTRENLKTTHYYGNAHIEVPYALVYSPNEEVNEGIYGRLYTWYSAVNIPEGSTIIPPVDADGFVTGICPAGWHIPAVPEIDALGSYNTVELHSTDHWVIGGGVNTTGFTLLPGGYYNSTLGRFEGMGSDARLWKIVGTTVSEPAAFCTAYYCDTITTVSPIFAADAFSVRCVKNY